ncbi:MAG: L,D-transpeptidase, partial [Myxococcota bacterium]
PRFEAPPAEPAFGADAPTTSVDAGRHPSHVAAAPGRDRPLPADDFPHRAMARVTPFAEAAEGPHGGLTSVRYQTFIYARPHKAAPHVLGYVRVGQRVALQAADKVEGIGCRGGFYVIAPRGFVCDDATVTREVRTPFLDANRHTLPRDTPFPYAWAISNGAPMYARLPSAAEQQRFERRYGPVGTWHPLPKASRGHEHLATTESVAPSDPLPDFLVGGRSARGRPLALVRKSVPHGTLFAFTRAFDHGGRTFLLSADLTVVPADRVRRFVPSAFHGVVLDDPALPRAWFRKRDRPRFRRRDDGRFEPADPAFPVRTQVGLTGREAQSERDGTRYLETEGGDWVAADDATVVTARDALPFGIAPGDKWILVSLSAGTLVAYEGLRPVFTTLVSPGRGGIPVRGRDPIADATTPLGTYRITAKDRAATMSSQFGGGRNMWIADVPFTQYFHAPFALHGAYWHERFGEPMSAGCINVSPLDAAWLFGWTGPEVPAGWHAVVSRAGTSATWVVVTR